MKVKRYIGTTVQEAVSKVKNELGKDAIILNTRKIKRKGWTGFFSRSLIEVVAAVDDTNKDIKINRDHSTSNDNDAVLIKEANNIELLQKQVSQIEATVNNMAEKMETSMPAANVSESSIITKLIKCEIHEEYAKKINHTAGNLSQELHLDRKASMIRTLEDLLGEPQPLLLSEENQRRILFIGATGVGKTTTLAKLAAMFSIQHKKKVALVTADTYRIAAIDQLKTYAEILEIPLAIAYSPNEMIKAIEEHKQKDMIFIDTAGKGLNDKSHEKEISDLINLSKANEIYLVISSNTSYQGCMNIINRYNFIEHYKLIFTKVDDAAGMGFIFNCCMLSGRPLSYITTGQSVPDDIDVADPKRIVAHLMKRVDL